MMLDALRFALTLAVLYAGHSVADHWIQTHAQAMTKGQCDLHGRATARGLFALLRHVTTYTLTLAVVLGIVAVRFPGLSWSAPAMAAGLAFNGLSHAWADHRPNLRRLAVRFGKASYYDMANGTGAYALDQAFHVGFLFISALIISA